MDLYTIDSDKGIQLSDIIDDPVEEEGQQQITLVIETIVFKKKWHLKKKYRFD